MDRIGAVWVEEGDSSVTFRVRSRRLLLRCAGWALMLGGVVGLAQGEGDSVLLLAMLAFAFGMITDFVATLLATSRNPKGCITPVERLTIHGSSKARGYREAPAGPTLEAAGKRWPLEQVRHIDIGHRVVEDRHGRHEAFTTYVVMPDQVLQLSSSPERSDAVRLAKRLRAAIDPELAVAKGGDHEPLSAGLAVVLAVALVGMVAVVVFLVAVPAGWMNRWVAIASAVAAVLVMRLIISNISADEDKLNAYAARRFGVEAAGDGD